MQGWLHGFTERSLHCTSATWCMACDDMLKQHQLSQKLLNTSLLQNKRQQTVSHVSFCDEFIVMHY